MHRTFAGTAFALAFASLLVAGCGSSTSNTNASCDTAAVTQLFTTKYVCSGSGCHDTVTKAANFDMTGDFASRLVGVSPPGGGPTIDGGAITSLQSMCTGMGFNYLDPGSSPATGLLLKKLAGTAGCGMRMPYAPAPAVTSADMACIQTWANGLTAGHGG
jgi:hypothetical protein